MSRSAIRLDLRQARSAAIAVQELGGGGDAKDDGLGRLLERTGFVRTLGGVDAYLALRARRPGLARAEVDAAILRGELRVVPAVRGCIHLVAARDAPLALQVAETLSARRTERELSRAEVRPGEIDDVGKEIVTVLSTQGPLATDVLRRGLPRGTVRSLGEAGKNVGISSTLPPALRRLELDGRIERMLEGGRLDTERYLWRLHAGSPPNGRPATERWTRLAEIFLAAAAFAGIDDFAAWSGATKRDAKAAFARLDAIPVSVEGIGEAWALPSRREILRAPPAPAPVAFLPFEDNLLALHGGPALFVDAAHHAHAVPGWGRRAPTSLGDSRHMSLRSVVADGRVAGLWEWDPDVAAVEVGLFDSVSIGAQEEIARGRQRLARFVSAELRHARSYSLDDEVALRKRAAAIRELDVGTKAAPTTPAAKTTPSGAMRRAKSSSTKRAPTRRR